MKKMTVSDFSKQLTNLKSAVIFCHARPDGDTLSCAFALYYVLKKLGKKVDVACSGEVSSVHDNWIPFKPLDKIECKYDGYISVDAPTAESLGEFSRLFLKQNNTFCIDHHVSNTRYAKYSLIGNKPSCTMVILEIFKQIGVEMDTIIAGYLLTGIMTDTNNFSVAGLDGEVFVTVSELISYGADFSTVYDNVVCNVTKEKAKVFGLALSKVRYFCDDRLAIMTVSKKDLEDSGADNEASVGLVDYLMKIAPVDVGICLLEAKNNFYRISFRSKKCNVSEIAAVFGGGGHKNASGAVLTGYYEDVIDKLVFTVGNYL